MNVLPITLYTNISMDNIVTLIIVIGTSIFSYMAFNDRALFEKYMFNAYAIRSDKQHYRFLSHAFIHADWMHLIMNMYVLYSFGKILETALFPALFGNKARLFYILLYTGAIYASSVADFIRHRNNPGYNAVGASGAVSAVLFSFILIMPWQGISIMFIPVYIPGWIMGTLYLIYSFYMDKRKVDNIGHGAHAWGAVFGFVFTGLLKPQLFLDFIDNILSKGH